MKEINGFVHSKDNYSGSTERSSFGNKQKNLPGKGEQVLMTNQGKLQKMSNAAGESTSLTVSL